MFQRKVAPHSVFAATQRQIGHHAVLYRSVTMVPIEIQNFDDSKHCSQSTAAVAWTSVRPPP